jgi:predicted dehydrogenase
MSSADNPIRLAILGCGAITRCAHLPVAIANPAVRVVALVDADEERARALASSHRLNCKITRDHREILSEVDAVVNALPNHLHVPVSTECLRAAVHVLCEKPLAATAAEARACCELAQERGLVLAVGLNRRFEPSVDLLSLALGEGLLGQLEGYDWQYGAPYEWNTFSGFYFSRAQAGGGVLLDYGVHMLDSLLHWFGPVTNFTYHDDNLGGGIEANVIMTLHHSGKLGEIEGQIRLSRTFNLRNSLVVKGSAAQAEITLQNANAVVLHRMLGSRKVSMTLRMPEAPAPLELPSFHRQLENFVQSVKGTTKPVVDGWQALAVIELVQRCYQQAQRLPEPWSQDSLAEAS